MLAITALGAWSAAPVAAACLALVELITFFDNTVVSLGNRLGISDVNRRLNRARFFLHAVFIAGLIPVYVGIGRLVGAAGFDSVPMTGVTTVVTLAVMLFGYFIGYRRLKFIMPVNYYGCLRYAQSVNAASRRDDYDYSPEELAQKGLPPFASIITVILGLVLSIWIGISTGFWVPAIVTGMMLLAGAFPANAPGALATSGLEIVFSCGIVYSLVSLSG